VALRHYWRARLFAMAVPIILATAGCSGDGWARQPVAGFVYLDGRPLSEGLIMFYPVENTKLAIVTNGGAMVRNGYFSLPRSEGLAAGKYHVAISAPAPDRWSREETRGPERGKVVANEVIPARYNNATGLRLELNDHAIKEVTFHLDSK
jgi:hypothetical protein